MSHIPIKYAIESGCLFKGLTGDSPPFEFRIKILSFEQLNISKLDDPKKIDKFYDLNQGVFMILRFEIISLHKLPIYSKNIHSDLLIIDQDGFQFKESLDYHLSEGSEFSKKMGLHPFLGADLVPKIKYTGAVPFYVPKEDHAEYSFSIYKGSVQEM